jgi:DNA-binding FadR family transcriptional regulator
MSDNVKLYRKIADSVADAIESGQYKLGDRLPTERELAEQFGVSRPTLREAMIALEMLGMIEARHGLGIYVTGNVRPSRPVGRDRLRDRRLRADRGPPPVRGRGRRPGRHLDQRRADRRTRGLLERMHQRRRDRGEDADRDFHMIIARATGNGAIIATIENLWDWRNRSPLARNILTRARGMGLEPRIVEHRRVVDALKARDPAAARQAMRDHLERVIDHLLHATETEAVQRASRRPKARRSAIAKRVAISAHLPMRRIKGFPRQGRKGAETDNCQRWRSEGPLTGKTPMTAFDPEPTFGWSASGRRAERLVTGEVVISASDPLRPRRTHFTAR